MSVEARMTSTGGRKMEKNTPNTVGVDISKAHLSYFR